MFDNLLFQDAGIQLADDLRNGVLPNALLFSGVSSSGKLTCALELARVLSCTASPSGSWTCTCPSCLKHKALSSTSLLLAGSRCCTLEIAAASKALLGSASGSAPYLNAVRYLFIRSIRKLTLRFSPVLWEGDDKASKMSSLLSGIDEYLEELDPMRPLPEFAKLEKICSAVLPLCAKLEGDFMYDSIPVAQIRRVSAWAHYRSESGKKVVVLENADRMQESVRNALLKILEEPPEDVVFVLTTTRRNAIIPTILSRLRAYNFVERSEPEQKEVVRRVFHAEPDAQKNFSVDWYLQSFLPVDQTVCASSGRSFVSALAEGAWPDIDATIKTCGNFEPRLLFSVFLNGLTGYLRDLATGSSGSSPSTNSRVSFAELASEGMHAVHECVNNVTIYNQSIASALEVLAADLVSVFRKYGV